MKRLVFGAALFVVAIACMPAASLENTEWKVKELGGKAVQVENENQRPHIILRPASQQVSGFGGCNNFQGVYDLKDDNVRFRNMLGTLRACVDQAMNERERQFMDALSATTSFKLKGGTLELFDGSRVVARFSTKE